MGPRWLLWCRLTLVLGMALLPQMSPCRIHILDLPTLVAAQPGQAPPCSLSEHRFHQEWEGHAVIPPAEGQYRGFWHDAMV